MKIGLVSDSHGDLTSLKAAVTQMGDVELIFHMGDYVSDGFDIQKWVSIPVMAVRGNMDAFYGEGEDYIITEEEGHRILICHGHTLHVKNSLASLIQKAKNEKVDIICFGHTHIPRIKRDKSGILIINPGSVSLPKGGCPKTYGLLTIEDDRVAAEIIDLKQDGNA